MRLYRSVGTPLRPDFEVVYYPGERLCDMIYRARMNGAPIDSTSQPFYDEDDDDDSFDVDPVTDIRTDKWSLAEIALLETPKTVSTTMTRDAEQSAAVVEDQSSDTQSVIETPSVES